MNIKIPLIFHFNQHTVEFARLASSVCYKGLLRVLLNSPVRANIHISGTLVQALRWLDPEPLEMIRTGLKNGKFEILGSTHAQNILISVDRWDNEQQMDLHREILGETFSVHPTAFWNPERCWNQSLVSLLANRGYEYVTIEDHILDQSQASERIVYRTGWEGRFIKVIRDDEKLKHLFNFGAWFGKTSPLHAYLDQVTTEKESDPTIFAYAEDAEAMGLWGFSANVIPEQTWDRLAEMLNEIARRGDVETILMSEIPDPVKDIERIDDGSAAWMDASLKSPNLPYHEDGFENWFHFNKTSLKLDQAREMYGKVRAALKKAPAEDPMTRLARNIFLTHQYEFGCIGIGGEKNRAWSGAVSAISMIEMASAQEGIHPAKWNGGDEILFRENDQVVMLSPIGGRLIYWADLRSGRLIIGNPGSVVPGKPSGEAVAPGVLNYPWAGRTTVDDYTQHNQPVEHPTPLNKFLPDWIWDSTDETLTLASFPPSDTRQSHVTLAGQQGAFLDEIIFNGQAVSLDHDFSRNGLAFEYILAPGTKLEKQFSFSNNGLSMDYKLSGTLELPVELRISVEISGDYAENLDCGRSAIRIFQSEDAAGVETLSGDIFTLRSSLQNGRFEVKESFHAALVTYIVSVNRLDEEPLAFTLSLASQ